MLAGCDDPAEGDLPKCGGVCGRFAPGVAPSLFARGSHFMTASNTTPHVGHMGTHENNFAFQMHP